MLTRRSMLTAAAALGALALPGGGVVGAFQLTGDDFPGFRVGGARSFETIDEYAAIAAGLPPVVFMWMQVSVFETPGQAAAARPLLTGAMQERMSTFSFLEWVSASVFTDAFIGTPPETAPPEGFFIETYTLRPELEMAWMEASGSPLGLARLDWVNGERVYITLAAAGSWGDYIHDYSFRDLGVAALSPLLDAGALTPDLTLSDTPMRAATEETPASGGVFSLFPDPAGLAPISTIDPDLDDFAETPEEMAVMITSPI
ncbi:MAG: hypothetical protein QM692_08445 [Thermomicrobiales bacterium]